MPSVRLGKLVKAIDKTNGCGRITICNCFFNDWEKRNEKISSKNSTIIE